MRELIAAAFAIVAVSACLAPPAPSAAPTTSSAVEAPASGKPPWCEWHPSQDPPHHAECLGLKPEPWCVWVQVWPMSRSAEDWCTSTGAGVYTIEALAGQRIIIRGVPDDDSRYVEENGRPYFVQIFNRTGKAHYEEWPVRVGEKQVFHVDLPPDPPYYFHTDETAVSAQIDATRLPGNWTEAQHVAHFFSGDPFAKSYVWGKLRGELRIPIGSTTGVATLELPWGAVYANSGVPIHNATGHTRGNFTIWDPLDRLNLAYDNTGLMGSKIHVWGFPPIEGTWRFELRLPQPAIQETLWPVSMEYQMLNLTLFRTAGFDWPVDKTGS